MDQLVDDTVFARRSVSLLVLGFAAFGLVLASVGLYAVIAYSVHQRRPEIGIRMALGAAPRTVQARVLAETLRLVVAGVAIGLPLAWAVSRALRGLLFGVQPADPATLALVLGVLVLVAGVAGYVPARRAARVDPVEVLRSA
jgi:ABC-type antimicrobial peptide transport system permease subunit